MKCNFIFKPTLFSIFPERQNHARELIREISLPEWDGIVIVSGDGLLHEVSFTFVLDKSVVQGRIISSECIIKVYFFYHCVFSWETQTHVVHQYIVSNPLFSSNRSLMD